MKNLNYKEILNIRFDTERRLEQVRAETRKIIESRRSLERLRLDQFKENQEKLREAVRQRDIKSIALHSKNMAKIEKEVKALKNIAYTSYKIIKLSKANTKVTQKINTKLEAMALREARANNIITRKIAALKNGIEHLKVKGLEIKSNFQQFKLVNNMGTYNKNMNRSVQFDKSNLNIPRLATLKTHLYSRSNELNKDLLKDYTIKKENEKITTYKCNKSGATIEDDNISLTLRDINNNMSDKDKAKALIDVAIAKGWDISKVEVFGSGFFKVEFEKQLPKNTNIENL